MAGPRFQQLLQPMGSNWFGCGCVIILSSETKYGHCGQTFFCHTNPLHLHHLRASRNTKLDPDSVIDYLENNCTLGETLAF